jgi:hypothetical protein
MLGTLIQTQSIGSAVASVTFSSIPQTYTDLYLVYAMRNKGRSQDNNTKVTVNGSSTGYSERYGLAYGSSAQGGTGPTTYWAYSLFENGGASTAKLFNNGYFAFPNYAASGNKIVYMECGCATSGSQEDFAGVSAGVWTGNAAISSITITPGSANIEVGSIFSLYGLTHF